MIVIYKLFLNKSITLFLIFLTIMLFLKFNIIMFFFFCIWGLLHGVIGLFQICKDYITLSASLINKKFFYFFFSQFLVSLVRFLCIFYFII